MYSAWNVRCLMWVRAWHAEPRLQAPSLSTRSSTVLMVTRPIEKGYSPIGVGSLSRLGWHGSCRQIYTDMCSVRLLCTSCIVQERTSTPRRLHTTYEEILARQPKSTQAGDAKAAEDFAVFLSTILVSSEKDTLTESQRVYLYRLRTKWDTRSRGEDLRWNMTGTKPGRPAHLSSTPKRTRHDPDEDDPLFVSLVRKYGTPVSEGGK